jgi:CRISPR-associated protein Cmr6
MAIAAVPRYLGDDYSQASPGLRFGMYLKLWGVNSRTGDRLWTTYDINYRIAGRDREEREFRDESKTGALRESLKLSLQDQAMMAALATRQAGLARQMQSGGYLLRLETMSIAPFATGLGNEHPLENGFAFLNPYGLPYLAGSGVKGVLRQAARELARGEWGDRQGWSEDLSYTLVVQRKTIKLSMLDVLFGRESADGDTDHVRGALTFWDVFPQLKGNALQVEVMTPHQTHYYQRGETPHESGSPNPINFLTVPPGSDFAFHVQCDRPHLARLALDLAKDDRWRQLIAAAFEHAFAWLGFGAKTAVGYGAMQSTAPRSETRSGTGDTGPQASDRPPVPQEEWSGVELKFNPGNAELTVSHQGKLASLRDPESQQLRERLPDELKARLKKQRVLKNCVVGVERIGNAWRLAEIRAVSGVDLPTQ